MAKLKCFAIDREEANGFFRNNQTRKSPSIYNEINKRLKVVEADNFDRRTLAEVKVSVALLTHVGNQVLKTWDEVGGKCSVLLDIGKFYAEIVEKEEIVGQFCESPDEDTGERKIKPLKDTTNAMQVISDKTNLFLFAANLSSALIAHYGEIEDRFSIKIVSSFLSNERAEVVILRRSEAYLRYDLSEKLHVVVIYPVRKENIYPECYFTQVEWQEIAAASDDAARNRDKYTEDSLVFLTAKF